MKILKIQFFLLIIAVLFMAGVFTAGVSAQQQSENSLDTLERVPCDVPDNRILGIPAWYIYLDGAQDPVPEGARGRAAETRCTPVIDTTADALPIGLAVLEAMLTIGGIVAVVMVFVGSFRFVLTQGNPDNATSARKTIINALIGLVILIVSTRVVSFIGNRLG